MARFPKLAWISLVVFLGNYAIWYYTNYRIWYDTYDWVGRASIASHAGDMAEYLNRGIEGMKRWGFTEGHAALVFPSPANDMSLIMKSLERLKERADLLAKAYTAGNPPTNDKLTTVEYNQAMDDLRSSMYEYPMQADYYWDVHFPGIIVSSVYYISLLSLVASVVYPLIKLE